MQFNPDAEPSLLINRRSKLSVVPVELKPEQRKRALASIKTFALQELDQDLGDLKAELVLEFMLKEIAPCVYNQAIADAQAYLRDRVADMEGRVLSRRVYLLAKARAVRPQHWLIAMLG